MDVFKECLFDNSEKESNITIDKQQVSDIVKLKDTKLDDELGSGNQDYKRNHEDYL